MSVTYQQPEKAAARQFLWEHAVRSLTNERSDARVLRDSYIRALWEHARSEYLCKYYGVTVLDAAILDEWCRAADAMYGRRSPGDLRVVYLAGPEPENDLAVLQSLGVRTEHIWAVEEDRAIYEAAVARMRGTGNPLKLFYGSIESFLEVYPGPFDIVYLDFTRSLIAAGNNPPFLAVHRVFDQRALADLGALIVTTTDADSTPEVVEFLTDYFYYHESLEGSMVGERTDEGVLVTWSTDGAICRGLDPPEFRRVVANHVTAAYSAFMSSYPVVYANNVVPAFRVLKTESARRRFFDSSAVELGHAQMAGTEDFWSALSWHSLGQPPEGWGPGGDLILSPTDYPLRHFIDLQGTRASRVAKRWREAYTRRDQGVSRLDGVQLYDMLRSVVEGFFPILSESLREAVGEIYAVIPDGVSPLFCDPLLPHIWAELALNQLGAPHHHNLSRHRRICYRAKTRMMLSDVFILDRCRPLYEFIPAIELWAEDLSVLERQLIVRLCLDAIIKQSVHTVPRLYRGSNVICFGERSWARFADIQERIEISQ